MLILQLLKSKSIGIESIHVGSPAQKARLQAAYIALCSKYESEYNKKTGAGTVMLEQYIEEFKAEVHAIFWTSYE